MCPGKRVVVDEGNEGVKGSEGVKVRVKGSEGVKVRVKGSEGVKVGVESSKGLKLELKVVIKVV